MSWSKRIIINYHYIETLNTNFSTHLNSELVTAYNTDKAFSFEKGPSHFLVKVNDKIELDGNIAYFISLVKEKNTGTVCFNNNDIYDIPVADGKIGELHYALIIPTLNIILSFAASGGGSVGNFKKFLVELAVDGNITLMPVLENKIDIQTLSWDFYKKIGVSLRFPAYNYKAEFMASMTGTLFGLLDEVDGLSVNITVAAPKAKQQLNATQIKKVTKTLLANEFCNKLILKGADDAGEEIQEFVLKNAQVKYKEFIEVTGSYINEFEALPLLKRAYNDRKHEFIGVV